MLDDSLKGNGKRSEKDLNFFVLTYLKARSYKFLRSSDREKGANLLYIINGRFSGLVLFPAMITNSPCNL